MNIGRETVRRARLEGIVMRCLARDPDERYADASELVEALARCPMRGASEQERLAEWGDSDVTLVEGREQIFTAPALATLGD